MTIYRLEVGVEGESGDRAAAGARTYRTRPVGFVELDVAGSGVGEAAVAQRVNRFEALVGREPRQGHQRAGTESIRESMVADVDERASVGGDVDSGMR